MKILENKNNSIKPIIASDFDKFLIKPNSDNLTDKEKISNVKKALKEVNLEKKIGIISKQIK